MMHGVVHVRMVRDVQKPNQWTAVCRPKEVLVPIEDSGVTAKKWVETWKMEIPHDHVALSHSDK
jgi:hypothetical protein